MPILSTADFIQKLNDILFVDPETGNYVRDPYHVKDYLTARLLMQQIVEYSSSTNNFLALTDTPSSYSGEGGKMVVVNGGETELVFVDVPGPSVITNLISGNRIATHNDGAGLIVDIDETITNITDNLDGTFTYTKEDGSTVDIDLSPYWGGGGVTQEFYLTADSGGTHTVNTDGTETVRIIGGTDINTTASTGAGTTTLTISHANTSSLSFTTNLIPTNHVITDLRVDNQGHLTTLNTSALTDDDSISVITNTIAGNRIATHDDGNGTLVDIDETITGLALSTNDLIYTKEDGSTDTIDLSGYIDDTTYSLLVPAATTLIRLLGSDASTSDITLTGSGATTVSRISATELQISSTDTDTTYTGSNGVTLVGTDFQHDNTSSQSSVNNLGRTYIQDITLDGFGHVTGLTSATETVVDTNDIDYVSNVTLVGTDLTFTGVGNAFNSTVDLSSFLDDTNTTSVITNLIAGNRIATHNDGDSTTVDIDESITTITDNTDGTWTYTKEGGTTDTIDITTYVASQLPDNLQLQNTLIVAKNGNDTTGTRNDWELPYLTIAAAISDASNGDTIIVMPGTYNEDLVILKQIDFNFIGNCEVYSVQMSASCTIRNLKKINHTASSGAGKALSFFSVPSGQAYIEVEEIFCDKINSGIYINNSNPAARVVVDTQQITQTPTAGTSSILIDIDQGQNITINVSKSITYGGILMTMTGQSRAIFNCPQAVWDGSGNGWGIMLDNNAFQNTTGWDDRSGSGRLLSNVNIIGKELLLSVVGNFDVTHEGNIISNETTPTQAIIQIAGDDDGVNLHVPVVVIRDARVRGYDNRATGKLVSLGGASYGGTENCALKLRFEDCFLDLDSNAAGTTVIELVDNSIAGTTPADFYVGLKDCFVRGGDTMTFATVTSWTPTITILGNGCSSTAATDTSFAEQFLTINSGFTFGTNAESFSPALPDQ